VNIILPLNSPQVKVYIETIVVIIATPYEKTEIGFLIVPRYEAP